MQNAVIGQYTHGFVPSGVHYFVFGRCKGKKFGQFQREGNGYIGIFRYDAIAFNRQKRELIFQSAFLADVSHRVAPFLRLDFCIRRHTELRQIK